LAGFITLSLSSGLIWYGFSILNKPISDEFGWGRGELTTGSFSFVIAIACFSPVVGRFVDRIGPRRIFLVGAIILASSLLMLNKVSSLWSFCLLHLALCIGAAVFS
jgi:MFS family permease